MRPLAIAACLLLASCSMGPPSEREAAKKAREATQLRDAMQRPIDKAKSVDDTQQKAADEQRKAVEDAGG